MSNDIYPEISDSDLRGDSFFEASVQPKWFSNTRGSLQEGDRLIIQKTNLKYAVVKAVMRDGKWRPIFPTYDPDHTLLISMDELKWIGARKKLVSFEGIDKYINPSKAEDHD